MLVRDRHALGFLGWEGLSNSKCVTVGGALQWEAQALPFVPTSSISRCGCRDALLGEVMADSCIPASSGSVPPGQSKGGKPLLAFTLTLRAKANLETNPMRRKGQDSLVSLPSIPFWNGEGAVEEGSK